MFAKIVDKFNINRGNQFKHYESHLNGNYDFLKKICTAWKNIAVFLVFSSSIPYLFSSRRAILKLHNLDAQYSTEIAPHSKSKTDNKKKTSFRTNIDCKFIQKNKGEIIIIYLISYVNGNRIIIIIIHRGIVEAVRQIMSPFNLDTFTCIVLLCAAVYVCAYAKTNFNCFFSFHFFFLLLLSLVQWTYFCLVICN